MAQHPDAHGIAALGICESLILALVDLQVIPEKEATSLLTDVITAHTEAAETSPTPEKHRAVMEVVQQMLKGKNWPAG